MKHHVVLFGESGARIITTDDVSHFQGMANVAIDPDMSSVKGVAPHFWKLEESKIVAVAENSRKEPVPSTITEHKITFDPSYLHPHLKEQRDFIVGLSAAISAVTALVVTGIGFLIHFHH